MRKRHIKLTVTIEEEDGWWIATCPMLPGCVSQGKTEEEAVANIQDAIIGWLMVKNDLALQEARQQRACDHSSNYHELALSF